MERTVVNSKDKDGKDLVAVVYKPTAKQLLDAQIVASNKFKECLKAGVMLRASIEEELTKQGIWDKDKEAELTEIGKKINNAERKLARGGVDGFKKSEARDLALQMKDWRIRQTELVLLRRQLDDWTCESQAENTEFDYLVSVCSTTEDGRPLFSNLDDYRERAEEQVAFDVAAALAKLRNKVDLSWLDNLPENIFLKTNGFVDDKGRLVRKDGRLVDRDGKLINDIGRFVNEENELVDLNGLRVDEEGKPIETFTPWDSEE
jgi:ribosomal protein S16